MVLLVGAPEVAPVAGARGAPVVGLVVLFLAAPMAALWQLLVVASHGGSRGSSCGRLSWGLPWWLLVAALVGAPCGGSWAELLCGLWDLLGLGIKPMSPALTGRFLSTAPPGKPTIEFSVKHIPECFLCLYNYCK